MRPRDLQQPRPWRRPIEWAVNKYLQRRRRRWLRTTQGREFMEFLEKIAPKYKEKTTGILAAIVMALTAFGYMDWVAVLKPIHEAIAAGDWQAALATLVAFFAFLIRVFRRMAMDRNGGPKD